MTPDPTPRTYYEIIQGLRDEVDQLANDNDALRAQSSRDARKITDLERALECFKREESK
jgi:predicted RNase H-like nuclease (RuvC/YqgF family)